LAFARDGAKVVVADVDAEEGEETVQAIKETGGDASWCTPTCPRGLRSRPWSAVRWRCSAAWTAPLITLVLAAAAET